MSMNADVTLEMGTPLVVSDQDTFRLAFAFPDSLVNARNAFECEPLLIPHPNCSLIIPVQIVVQNMSSPKGKVGHLPFWKLQLKNGVNGHPVFPVHLFHIGNLSGQGSGYFVLTDTFRVNLSSFSGQQVILEGLTFFVPGFKDIGIAEKYQLGGNFRKFGKESIIAETARDVPGSFALYPNYPNPFNPVTTIAFDLPEESNIKLEIYDITGRRIRILAEGHYPAGSHRVVWDGTDSRGHAVASGVYAYRLTTDTHVATRKLLLLK
ncbi:MAG: hypothetical protein Kow0042_14660 [Calditrichia bacterium]